MISAAALLLLAQAATASPAASPAAVPSPRPTPSGPVVVLETSMGRIRIGLYDDKSPVSTENFLKYVRKGHYNGTLFHRVMPNFMSDARWKYTMRTSSLSPWTTFFVWSDRL